MLTIEQCQNARMARDPRFDGRFFVLVITTGIFCRPVCKVRAPLERNVQYATSAFEAMQRGFRPCLRCRPDSLPNSYAWLGVETTVKRAMKLLTDDFAQSVSSVAARLGISERYLHKLMVTHVHIAPKQFRVFHQVLLAKRLLHHSDMSIEQVAEGAGFSSARQLQHHMKAVTDLSPSQVRKLGGLAQKDRSLMAKTTLLLNYRGDYDWPSVRDFFAHRIILNNESITDDSFYKSLRIDEKNIRVQMQFCPSKKGFSVSFESEYVPYTSQIIESVQRILDLHANPYVIAEALEQAGLRRDEINMGIRIPGLSTKFEAGIRAILGQQVSVSAAITQLNKLQQGLMGESDALLSPQHIIESELKFLRLPESRKRALKAFSELMHAHADADFEQYLAIKGVGPWTVNYVRLRASEDTDVWLNTDLIIKQQIKRFEEAGRHLQDDLAAPWRSYLTLSLWGFSV